MNPHKVIRRGSAAKYSVVPENINESMTAFPIGYKINAFDMSTEADITRSF